MYSREIDTRGFVRKEEKKEEKKLRQESKQEDTYI
jgi:hypothetical protein